MVPNSLIIHIRQLTCNPRRLKLIVSGLVKLNGFYKLVFVIALKKKY